MPVLIAVLISLSQGQGVHPETEESRIARLIERLSEDDIVARHEAAAELRTVGDAAIPALEAAAITTDPTLRLVVRRLLHDLSATSALIEDLRSDDIPDNARAARAKLRQRYGPKVRAALLEALRSDDNQQAVQSAYLLGVHRETGAALEGNPEILARVAGVMTRRRDSGFRWVAAEAVVRIGASAPEATREQAWRKALADVDPSNLHECFLAVHQVSARSGLPMPAPLVKRYLRNLMDDPVTDNAKQCRYVLRLVGPGFAPELRQVLAGYDSQARAMAVEILLEWKQEDLPMDALAEAIDWSPRARDKINVLGKAAVPSLLRVLRHRNPDVVFKAATAVVEIEPGTHDDELAAALSRLLESHRARWWRGESVEQLLRKLGPAAEKALVDGVNDAEPLVAQSAARGLLALDRERHVAAALERAERELKEDARRDNARRASQLLFDLGDSSLARLRAIVTSGRGQSLVCAAAVLARLGRLDELTDESLEAVLEFADRREEADEPGALIELITWSEPIRKAVERRLEKKGGSSVTALQADLLDQAEEPWLTGRR